MTTSPFAIFNQPPLDHERFDAHRELESQLKAVVRGEVKFDMGSRALYAADASNYRQLPVGVILPRDDDDVEAALAACRSVGAAVLARGGGTSLAGQCTNVAVVFDYSKHMNRLASIDPAAKLAVVQPGIVLDRLREAAEEHHLTYAPDPATHSRCTLGGMMGNNSCGVHGLLGGKTVDNVERLDIVLYDGTRMSVGKTSDEELAAKIKASGREGKIYAGLARIRDRYAPLIREKFPRIPRRVSGYNLDELLPENGFHVARALIGSEGTCATIVSATLNLVASPPYRVLTALGFPDAFLAADAVPQALEHSPIGLEGMDDLLLSFMQRKNLAVENLGLLPKGGGFLLVEMGAWTPEEAQSKAEALVKAAQDWPVVPSARIYAADEAKRVWSVRESALGATVFVPGEPEGWEGWEDAGIPPEHLGAYLRKLTTLMAEYGYRSALYGHFGQGCVHLRINFDFRSEKGIRDFREFLDRATDLVLSFGGSISGEHGDGQARAALLPKMFGPELMEGLREFKMLWDPANRMNPGKLIDAVRVYDPAENLRHSPSQPHIALTTHFAFSRDGGSLEHATERCVGVGACRKTEGGVMCPSYRATGDEQHSTRGRARLLWEMLSGDLRSEGFQSHAVHEALDLCLSCKACKTECPVQVDMAQYKSEFLAQRYKGKPHPLRHYVFGFADKLAKWGSITPGLTNAILNGPLTSPLIKRIVGIAKERELPKLAAKPYISSRKRDARTAQSPVLLWPDTWNNYYHPQTLASAESLLSDAGFHLQTPRGHICCGRPLYDFGLLDAAKNYLSDVLTRLSPEIDSNLPFIFLEPSCASVFKDELPELLPNDPRAARLRENVWLLADWLAAKAPESVAGRLTGKRVLIHGHCHHKAVFGGPKSEIALLRAAGATVEPIETTCCGMAGPFGFEAEKYEVSKTIANLGLLGPINSAAQETIIVADGFSCREQIAQLSHREAIHFAEALATPER
ncbi:FAD-binding and (Fe-S)-binding domain-containing protein [Terracidiphilus gabretensis]|uniref:FAD-binding and (Fe-S)-binding domain-containing protein n=1 Tax=Terracidiphilus gabretensis TaxID=1577687 RepID=UPI00071BC7FA|nr:FAD-binding and (Fe-S)-binding domain-containing protein [Terracidiphilus gabretensis]